MARENVDYGRLLESAHLTGYTAARACTALEELLTDDRWKSAGDGFENINDFLNSIDLSQFKIQAEQRKSLARKLAEIEASQRATARALGVSHPTVIRDLNGTHVPDNKKTKDEAEQVFTQEGVTEPVNIKESKSDTFVPPKKNVTDRPDPLSMSGADVAILAEKQTTKAYDKANTYGHDQGDEWYTPKWLFDSLGIEFDIDVCAPEDLTYVTTPAKKYFNITDNGLEQEWKGTVWCNPPYSDPSEWADKMVEHGDGLLLSHIPMNAGWCANVWHNCDGIRLFQAIEFVRPDGAKQRPGYWLQIASFGEKATKALMDMSIPNEVAENPRRVPSPMWYSK